jgi:hypothetical protein
LRVDGGMQWNKYLNIFYLEKTWEDHT